MTVDIDDLDALTPRFRGPMLAAATDLERKLNPPFGVETTGFIILAFPFGEPRGRCNLLSNVKREDIGPILRAQLEQWESEQ